MKKEIGGEFQLPLSCWFKKRSTQFARFIPQDATFLTSSGRDSLALIVSILGLTPDDEVLLPSYLCPEILRPFREAGITPAFYRINRNLSADLDDIERRIRIRTRAIMVIHYFGYPQPIEELKKLSEEHSLYLIEDAVQSFLSKYNEQPLGAAGDLAFTSFRKFLPVLDGSSLLINTSRVGSSNVKWARTSSTRLLYLCLRHLGMSLKDLYLKARLVPKPLFLWLLTRADEMVNTYAKPARISLLSKSLLCKADFDEIVSRRRTNFKHLLDNWSFDMIRPLFDSLPPGVCPLGFPVIIEDRDYVRQELIRRKVYSPIHWNLPPDIDEKEFRISWEISRHILTIPVDQRYGLQDMHYILEQIQEIVRQSHSKAKEGQTKLP